MGFINLMEDEHLADTAQDKLERIKDSANSLLRILDDVIDISKLNADKLTINMSDFDLHQLIHDTTALYDHKRKTDDVSYDIVIDDGVPQFIHSDADKIKQILSNLISNASKFTESGKIGIKASLLSADGQLKIMVEDTGIGINANGNNDLVEQIERPFNHIVMAQSNRIKRSGKYCNGAHNSKLGLFIRFKKREVHPSIVTDFAEMGSICEVIFLSVFQNEGSTLFQNT